MSRSCIDGVRIEGISTCVPPRVIENSAAASIHGEEEVRKVVGMAGVQRRRVVDSGTCASDLCAQAATPLLERLGWEAESIDALIMVTQSPDYLLPSTACLVHKSLGLGSDCAAFDVGLGCSGYPYGLYLASAMISSGGHDRVLLLHGETPSLFVAPEDRATSLLFGDAGSATALSRSHGSAPSYFGLGTDGRGYDGLIIRGGGFRQRHPDVERDRYLYMDGAAIFNFTIERVPPLIQSTLQQAGLSVADVDAFLFHQSNQFIMRYLMKKCGLQPEKVPISLADFGNTGGVSIPLTATVTYAPLASRSSMRMMAVGYGVGLSWSSALFEFHKDSVLLHREYSDVLS